MADRLATTHLRGMHVLWQAPGLRLLKRVACQESLRRPGHGTVPSNSSYRYDPLRFTQPTPVKPRNRYFFDRIGHFLQSIRLLGLYSSYLTVVIDRHRR